MTANPPAFVVAWPSRLWHSADIVEVSCSSCQRRYGVADHKVAGRIRQSRCRCGSVLIFDGRHLLPEGPAEAQASAPSTSPQEPRTIARINLRKPVASSQPETLPERSSSPESMAYLDSIADRIRPEWELTPHSQRVSPEGADPEVVVHYPAHWQPPPSQRRQLREPSGELPTAAVSRSTAPSTDALDEGWAAADDSEPNVPDAPTNREQDHTDPEPVFPAIRVAPEARKPPTPPQPQHVPQPLISDSTAPAALSQPLPPKAGSSRGGAWAAAGLAALAAVGLLWRSQTRGTGSTDATRAVASAEVSPPERARPQELAAQPQSTATPAQQTETPAPQPPTASAEPPHQDAAPASETEPRRQDASRAPAPAHEVRRLEQPPEPARKSAPQSQPDVGRSGPEPAASAPAADFDPEQVRALLAAAAGRASACSSETPGSGTVRVLLNPAGGVLNATVISGPFQGTPVAQCVERTFESTKTAPYRGRSLSTVVPFSLPGRP